MSGPLDRSSHVPLYVQLANLLAREIQTGRIPAEQLLPSEAELSERYGISRITVRQAMARLVQDRLVRRERGRGTFAAGGKLETQVPSVPSFEEELHALGLPFRIRFSRFDKVVPPPGVAAALHTPKGEMVYRLERIRLLRGQPFGIEIRYLPGKIGEKVSREQLRTGPVFSILRDVLRQPVTRLQFVVSCVPASQAEARLLKTKVGVPLLAREHTYFTADDRPVLAGTVLFRGDVYRFRFETGAGDVRIGSIFSGEPATPR